MMTDNMLPAVCPNCGYDTRLNYEGIVHAPDGDVRKLFSCDMCNHWWYADAPEPPDTVTIRREDYALLLELARLCGTMSLTDLMLEGYTVDAARALQARCEALVEKAKE